MATIIFVNCSGQTLPVTEPPRDYTAQLAEAKAFCIQKKLDTQYCILIDMNIHSGKNRLFFVELQQGKILYKALVSHGCCSGPWSGTSSADQPIFSNTDGSHCSALGKYKLFGRSPSDWGIGIKYLMHGYENSNSNAISRYIVFHSWSAIEDNEVFPYGTPEGWGCPAVSDNTLKWIDEHLQKNKKGYLMWIFR